MSQLVVGITGPIGSGVTTTAEAFEDNGFQRLRISDAIRKQAAAKTGASGTFTRSELQDIGNEFRKQDAAYWAKEVLAIAGPGDIVVESIRNPMEVMALSEKFGKHFFLIAVQTTKGIRWSRSTGNYNGDHSAFERDDKRDTEEDDDFGQQVDRCVQLADYVLVNDQNRSGSANQRNGIWADLKGDVELMRSANEYGTQGSSRAASKEEVAMAVAYAQSLQSACLKRYVGAVIVDTDGLPLSVGFNENPVPMKPCRLQYRYCFKDAEMEKSLEAMNDVRCPQCGKTCSQPKKPFRCDQCDANFKDYFFPSRNMEICTAIHAEERAIRSLGGRSAKGATLYCTTFPCFQCARYIIDAGIARVVYVEAYPVKQSLEFLELNNVKVDPFSGFKARAFNSVFKQVR